MLIGQLSLATNERCGDWYYRIAGPGHALAAIDGVWTVDAPHIHRARRALRTRSRAFTPIPTRSRSSRSCWPTVTPSSSALRSCSVCTAVTRGPASARKARVAEIEPAFDQAYAKTSLLLGRLGRAREAHEFGANAHAIQKPFLS